jgi:hypothetical protein
MSVRLYAVHQQRTTHFISASHRVVKASAAYPRSFVEQRRTLGINPRQMAPQRCWKDAKTNSNYYVCTYCGMRQWPYDCGKHLAPSSFSNHGGNASVWGWALELTNLCTFNFYSSSCGYCAQHAVITRRTAVVGLNHSLFASFTTTLIAGVRDQSLNTRDRPPDQSVISRLFFAVKPSESHCSMFTASLGVERHSSAVVPMKIVFRGSFALSRAANELCSNSDCPGIDRLGFFAQLAGTVRSCIGFGADFEVKRHIAVGPWTRCACARSKQTCLLCVDGADDSIQASASKNELSSCCFNLNSNLNNLL